METLAEAILDTSVVPGDAASWHTFTDRVTRLMWGACGPLDDVSVYALERLVSARRLWDPATSTSVEVLVGDLSRYRDGSPGDRVRLALEAEYGRVLPSLERSVFAVRSVPAPLLTFSSPGHASAAGERFSTFSPSRPVALVVPSRSRLKVVDGHHRTAAALAAGEREVLVAQAQG